MALEREAIQELCCQVRASCFSSLREKITWIWQKASPHFPRCGLLQPNLLSPTVFRWKMGELATTLPISWASLIAQMVNNLPVMQKTGVWSPGQEDPWRRECLPTPVFLPGEFHGERSLVGYNSWGHKELDTTEWLTSSPCLIVLLWGLNNKCTANPEEVSLEWGLFFTLQSSPAWPRGEVYCLLQFLEWVLITLSLSLTAVQ